MKALVLEKDKVLKLDNNRAMPEALTSDSVLIRIAACGICGSDIKRGFGNGAYHYPLIMGHEFSGIVEENSGNGQFKVGDRVAVFPLIPTNVNESAYQTGDYAQLKEYNYFGSRCDGAFAEYLRVPVANLFKLPDHVNLIHASMTEPAAVALHGVRKMSITAGNFGVVIGAGPIGNMVAQWLRIHGCIDVAVVDIVPEKLRIAQKMGFIPINSLQENPVDKVMELTSGEGAQNVVEACGLPQTFSQALKLACRAGQVVFMGNIQGEFIIGEKDFSSLLRRELIIYGTWNSKIIPKGQNDWSTVLNYMDKELQVEQLISDIIQLEDGPSIFDSIIQKKKFHNKVIFKLIED